MVILHRELLAPCCCFHAPERSHFFLIQNFINESFKYFEDHGTSKYYVPFWTGLLYNFETKKWVWFHGTAFSSDL